FFATGASGLMYQVVWSRMFGVVLGTTIHAVSTVLAVFMAGLALGSWIGGRILDRTRLPGLRVYGVCELCIGAWALLLPSLMDACDGVFRAVWPLVEGSPGGVLGLRSLLAAAVLLVPTTLMGATTPALARAVVPGSGSVGLGAGTLYAVNTLGAMAGCFVTGFVLLERLGLRGTLLAAAAANLLVGILALRLRAREGGASGVPADDARGTGPSVAPRVRRAVWLAFALSGFAALALEVLWTRSLMYFVSIDTWAFTAILTCFLAGLGAGSLLGARLAASVRDPLVVLALLQLGIAVSAGASVPLFRALHGLGAGGWWHDLQSTGVLGSAAFKLVQCGVVLLVPTFCMGMAFPLASQAYLGGGGAVAGGVGRLLAGNTAGAIAGSLVAGYALIPLLGLERAILALTLPYVVGALVLLRCAARNPVPRALAATALVGGLLATLLVRTEPMILRSSWFRAEPGAYRLLDAHEGVGASLAVIERRSGTRELNLNGITTAGDNYMDMQVHRMLSHLPMLLHREPRRVLVVGFGMGSTAWGCSRYPAVQVDVVEMLAYERETARHFRHVNHDVLAEDNVRFIQGDGRNLLLASRTPYDVISFNAIHPRYSANLYTVDFYRLCRERLAPDGVIVAWMTQASLLRDEWRMLCASMLEAFPEASLWYCNPQHFCLLATKLPLRVDPGQLAARMAHPGIAADLRESNLDDPYVLLGRHLLSGPTLRRYVAGAPLNTDDQPRIEFTREFVTEERSVIDDLVAARESAAALLAPEPTPGQRLALERAERSSIWMMRGQIELWYPTGASKAEIAFREGLLLWPENHDLRHNLGFSRLLAQRAAEGLRVRPDLAVAQLEAGRVAMEEGRLEQAASHLRAAAARPDPPAEAVRRLGLVLLLLDRPADAAQCLDPLVQRYGFDALARHALGVALQRSGQAEAGARHIRAARDSDPDAARLHQLLEQSILLLRSRRG
ncbi:MAG: fused MFS/spermidine synthase, partial [Planctomycetes bacterium]|nr:fused MFS/spermidine synthase [Planctomycetota bacterium]